MGMSCSTARRDSIDFPGQRPSSSVCAGSIPDRLRIHLRQSGSGTLKAGITVRRNILPSLVRLVRRRRANDLRRGAGAAGGCRR